MTEVRTRFAPSPTGWLHIGGARTALYSYLWARKHGGKFFLRIEDTDQTRYQPEAEQSIIDGLHWLGLNWDNTDLMHQSKRTTLYRQHAEQLISDQKAYYCFCTSERLELMREIQRKKGRAPKYDKTCYHLTPDQVKTKLAAHEPAVIRLHIPEEGSVVIEDLVRGRIEFQCAELDDQILLKSDGFPTYHLANVVDDHDMAISHVIRGEEWIPSTPKHVLLYQAFGWEPPTFAHLSLFINKGGGKLSKRDGAMSLLEYRSLGYLPEAVINFIALLGWNPKTEQEFFSLNELTKVFELHQVNTANPIFDTEKLDWFNGHYLRQLSLEQLTQVAQPFLPETEVEDFQNFEYLKKVVTLEQPRLKKLSDLKTTTGYFFTEQLVYDSALLAWKEKSLIETRAIVEQLISFLETQSTWTQAQLDQTVLQWIKDHGYKNGDVLWPTRLALTGEKFSPPPFAVAEVLGKERSLQRLKQALRSLTTLQ